jgi:hypothetical protein
VGTASSASDEFWRAGVASGDDRWYEVKVPIADRLYDAHLEELKKEAKKEAAGDG